MVGGNGTDLLEGGAGDDILSGGIGFDFLAGGAGNDTYRFERGDGLDVISDENRYTAQVTHNVAYTRQVASSWTETRTGSYTVSTPSAYDGEGNVIGYSTVTYTGSVQVTQYGTTTQSGTFQTTATETVTADAGLDVLQLGSGITSADVILRVVGSDLLVGIKANPNDTFENLTDVVRLRDWFTATNRVEQIRLSDGTNIDLSTVVQSSGMGTHSLAPSTVTGDSGANALSGGSGSDVLEGGAGNDIYRFGRGAGQDTILDDYWYQQHNTTAFQYQTSETYTYIATTANGPYTWTGTLTGVRTVTRTANITVDTLVQGDGGNDILQLDAGIARSDVRISLSGNDLLIGIVAQSGTDAAMGGLADVVRIVDWALSANRVETLRFADGATLDLNDIAGTSGIVTLDGSWGGAWIEGTGADDVLTGTANADTLIGSLGNDTIRGGAGDDTIQGGIGDDIIDGGAGNDTVIFAGNYSDYRITASGGVLTVRDMNGNDGRDVITDVRYLTFADATFQVSNGKVTPIARNDTLSIAEDTPVTISAATLLSNDFDIDSGTLSIGSVIAGSGGAVALNSNGDIVFTPNANFSGAANFSYVVLDGQGASTVATVGVTVTAVNDAPIVPGTITLTAIN